LGQVEPRVECLGQRSFRSTVIVQTHRDTLTADRSHYPDH